MEVVTGLVKGSGVTGLLGLKNTGPNMFPEADIRLDCGLAAKELTATPGELIGVRIEVVSRVLELRGV